MLLQPCQLRRLAACLSTEPRVRTQVSPCEICGRLALWQGFLRALLFPLSLWFLCCDIYLSIVWEIVCVLQWISLWFFFSALVCHLQIYALWSRPVLASLIVYFGAKFVSTSVRGIYFIANVSLCYYHRLFLGTVVLWSRGSSVSIVSDYGLDDRAIEVRSPAEARDFSCSHCVQTGCGARPASCTVGTGFTFPGVKRGRGETLTTHPHLVPGLLMSRSYTSCTPCASIGVLWDCFLQPFPSTGRRSGVGYCKKCVTQ
jgi:hypothetical protein